LPTNVQGNLLDVEEAKIPKAEIHILENRCKGCGFCIEFCPRQVLETSEKLNIRGFHPPKVVDARRCTLCDFCTAICPDFAIFVLKKNCKEGC